MHTAYTIGHSTRTIEEFVELLDHSKIEQLIDIRTIPRSRHNPQYSQDTLAAYLNSSCIEYVYLKELGGLRSGANTDTRNAAWRNRSFRAYANYMQTDAFTYAIEHLVCMCSKKRLAIMCAEAVPWRCHRSLVADALLVRGIRVLDIISKNSIKEHVLTAFAVVDGTQITYPLKTDHD